MAVVLNASGVNRVRFTVINNMKSLFHPQREIHYIGGTDILPPPLEPEEEAYVLSQLDTRRSEEAKALLIERNLRLVVYIAKKFENTGIGVEDLISIGTIGLIKAIQTFKLDKKIKLATYASRCIENEILMYLRRTNKTKMEVSIDEPLNGDFIRQRKTYHSAPVWDRRRGKRRKDAERSCRLAGNFTVLYLQAGEEDYPSVEAGDD